MLYSNDAVICILDGSTNGRDVSISLKKTQLAQIQGA